MKHGVPLLILAATTACASATVATPPAAAPQGEGTRIEASRLPLVRHIDERFQSFQIGMSHLTGGETWKTYDPKASGGQAANLSAIREARAAADLSSRRLRNLTTALSPLYIRYGGTTSNSVYFQDNDEPKLAKAPDGYSVVLTRAGWKAGLDFAKAVNAKVLTGFTVSPGVRDASGAWTPRMAAPWLAYTHSVGGEIYAAELFNEPNAPDAASAPKGLAPADYARDFAAFRSYLAKAAPRLKAVGPGVTKLGIPIATLDGVAPEAYMTAAPKPQFDIVSYHFYGALAERCAPANSPAGIAPENALSEAWLARPDGEFQRFKGLRDRYAPGAPIWLTETGAAACGGPRWQPTFIDTFRYLDTHARLARQGLDAMFTHALISGSNGLVDEKTFLPNADYWAALLWRRLMGTGVLDAGPNRPGLHLYAHCLRGSRGGVALLAINLGTTASAIDVAGPVQLYALTAPELQSRTVLLNGNPLALGSNDTVPATNPVGIKAGPVALAPTSVNFIALPQARNASCMR